jgi:hypothetical protein
MILLIIISITVLLYLVFNLILTIAIPRKDKESGYESSNPVSIIIAAKNEEENITHLITSLKELSCDKENWKL